MARGANSDLDIPTGGSGVVNGATSASDRRLHVIGMYISLHVFKKERNLSHCSGEASGTKVLRRFLETGFSQQKPGDSDLLGGSVDLANLRGNRRRTRSVAEPFVGVFDGQLYRCRARK